MVGIVVLLMRLLTVAVCLVLLLLLVVLVVAVFSLPVGSSVFPLSVSGVHVGQSRRGNRRGRSHSVSVFASGSSMTLLDAVLALVKGAATTAAPATRLFRWLKRESLCGLETRLLEESLGADVGAHHEERVRVHDGQHDVYDEQDGDEDWSQARPQ